MFQTPNVNVLQKEVAHLQQVLNVLKKDSDFQNKIILAFLYRETPKIFDLGIRIFKTGTQTRHSMSRAIYFYLACKHGHNVCKSDLARQFNVSISNVSQRINQVATMYEVQVGYEAFIEKGIIIEKNLLNFLSTTNGKEDCKNA